MQRRNPNTAAAVGAGSDFLSPKPSSTASSVALNNELDKSTRKTVIVGGIIVLVLLAFVVTSSSSSASIIDHTSDGQQQKQQPHASDDHKQSIDDSHGETRRRNAPVRSVPFVPNKKAQAMFGGGMPHHQQRPVDNKKLGKTKKSATPVSVAPVGGGGGAGESAGSAGSSSSSSSNNNNNNNNKKKEEVTVHNQKQTSQQRQTEQEKEREESTSAAKATSVSSTILAAEKKELPHDSDKSTTTALVPAVSATSENQTQKQQQQQLAVVSCYDWKLQCSGPRSFLAINVHNKKKENPALKCSFLSRIGRKVDLGEYGLKELPAGAAAGAGAPSIGGCIVPIMSTSLNRHHDRQSAKSVLANPPPHFLGDDIVRCFDLAEKFPLLQAAQVIVQDPDDNGFRGGSKLACYPSSTDLVCQVYAMTSRWEPVLMDMLAFAGIQLRRFRQLQFLNFVRQLKGKVDSLVAASKSSKSSSTKKKSRDGEDKQDEAAHRNSSSSASSSSSTASSASKAIQWALPNIVSSSSLLFAEQHRPVLHDHIDPNTITDDNYGVEFVDIGLHVGTMSSMMWRMGFPIKGFEPMHTNLNLLLATRCLNRLATEFSPADSATCKAQLSAEIPPRKVRRCLTKKVSLSNGQNGGANGGAVGRVPPREESLVHSQCPVAEAVPFQLAHAAMSANSGEICTMFSSERNIGDVFVSCDKNLTETAKHHDVVFIRDSWYHVRGHVKTRQVDEYIYSTPEEACARVDEGVGGVRFQHAAYRRRKEVENAIRGAYFDYQKRKVSTRNKKEDDEQGEGEEGEDSDHHVALTLPFVKSHDPLLSQVYPLFTASPADDQQQQKQKLKQRNGNSSSSSPTWLLSDFEYVAAARVSQAGGDLWRNRRMANPSADQISLAEKSDRLLLGEITNHDEDDAAAAAVAGKLSEGELDEKIEAFEKELAADVFNDSSSSSASSNSLHNRHNLRSSGSSTANFDFKDYIVKIDVEGHEGQLLAGATRWLADPVLRPKMLLIETWTHLDVSGFCKKMLRHKYVGLSSRVWPFWMVDDKDCDDVHAKLKGKEAHDDSAWIPLEWAPILVAPEAVKALEKKLGRKLETPA